MRSFQSLKNDLMENRWRILIGLVALLIVDVLQLIIPRIIKHAIDDLTWGAIPSSRLLLYGGEVLALALGIGGFRYVGRDLVLGAARRLERAPRERFFLPPQSPPPSYFSRTKGGGLMSH